MSKNYQQLVVKPHRPGQRRTELILWLSFAVMLFALGLILGLQIFSSAMSEKEQQQLELLTLQKEVASLEQKLTNAEMEHRVDSVALEQVRKLLASLKTQQAADKEELSLYRNLLQTGGSGNGLLIGDLVLKQVQNKQTINYRLVIQQKDPNFQRVKVAAAVTVKGEKDGEEQSLGFDLLDSEIDSSPIQIEFKYFHILEGVMTLPPGFAPAQVVAEIWKKGASKRRVERSFDWQVN